MYQRKTYIVGNWKMNLNIHESSVLINRLDHLVRYHQDVKVILAPTFLTLYPVYNELNHRKFSLAAQNGYFEDHGAYTGEVSFAMMRGLVDYAIIGHSARRIYFHEGLEEVRDKVKAAIRNNISPIICIGETKPERLEGATFQVIHDQLTTAIYHLTAEELYKVIFAYEPIWAISTFDGEPSNPDDMQKVLHFMRQQINDLYGQSAAEEIVLLYGGSVDQYDIRAYLTLEDCDGVLAGASSLKYDQFAKMIEIAHEVRHAKQEN
jgi:triosephosphate isomerase